MKRALTLTLAAMLMFAVAVLAAFTSMRLAIHGREIDVPSLAGLSDADAASTARKLGLDLSVENRFYSGAVPANHVLSQSPAAGALVRRGSQVRVTESLGGQQMSIPDVVGQTERPAALVLRRLQLDVGATAHLPAAVPDGMVIAQSPPANSNGIVGPKVALLVAEPESTQAAQSYVMPQIVGMTLGAATYRLATAGLHISSAQDPQAAPLPSAEPATTDPNASPTGTPGVDPAIPPTIVPPVPPSPSAVINSQSPAPGRRVSRADAIRVTVAHPADVLDLSIPTAIGASATPQN